MQKLPVLQDATLICLQAEGTPSKPDKVLQLSELFVQKFIIGIFEFHWAVKLISCIDMF